MEPPSVGIGETLYLEMVHGTVMVPSGFNALILQADDKSRRQEDSDVGAITLIELMGELHQSGQPTGNKIAVVMAVGTERLSELRDLCDRALSSDEQRHVLTPNQ